TSFSFQAEDGIRVFHVTGVQTCALPIYWPKRCDGSRRKKPTTPTASSDAFCSSRAVPRSPLKSPQSGRRRCETCSPQISRTKSRSEEHTSELQSRENLVCRLLLEKKKEI